MHSSPVPNSSSSNNNTVSLSNDVWMCWKIPLTVCIFANGFDSILSRTSRIGRIESVSHQQICFGIYTIYDPVNISQIESIHPSNDVKIAREKVWQKKYGTHTHVPCSLRQNWFRFVCLEKSSSVKCLSGHRTEPDVRIHHSLCDNSFEQIARVFFALFFRLNFKVYCFEINNNQPFWQYDDDAAQGWSTPRA